MRYLSVILCLLVCFPLVQAQTFSEVSEEIGINIVQKDMILTGGGCAFFDYDNDGFEDIFMSGGRVQDGLYRNNGDGTFTNTIVEANLLKPDSLTTNGVTIGDINNDGCKDVFLSTTMNGDGDLVHEPSLLFINNCDGTFTDISVSSGISPDRSWGIGATMGDVNMDGWLDIYSISYIELPQDEELPNGELNFTHIPQDNYLYINNGDNTFTEMGAAYGVDDYGCSLAGAFTDYDFDRDVDLIVINDFGAFVEPTSLYQNDYPNPSFIDVGDASGINSQIYGMGVAIGDYDEDGDLDYYEANWAGNVLHQNQGDGTFVDKAIETGTDNYWVQYNSTTTVSWSTFFGDFDNDSDLDLFVANGFMPSGAPVPIGDIFNYDAYFQNNGDGTFTNIANLLGINNEFMSRGAAMGDYDNDGDLDYAVVVLDEYGFTLSPNEPLRSLVFRNETNNNYNWIGFQLQGSDIIRDAYGSRVELFADGRTLIREVDGGSGHCSHNSSRIHFGLADMTEVDSVRFHWLGGGTETLKTPELNQYHLIVQGEVPMEEEPVSVWDYEQGQNWSVYPTKVDDYIHIELKEMQGERIHYSIYDTQGKKVMDLGESIVNQSHKLETYSGLDDLSSGVYFLKMDISGRVISSKFYKY